MVYASNPTEELLMTKEPRPGDAMSCIWLPHRRRYLDMCKQAKSITESGGAIRLTWNGPWLDAEGWKREFRKALDRRINLRGGPKYWDVGRKKDPDYQHKLRADARAINNYFAHRIRPGWNRWQTAEMQQRYGWLIEQWREDY